jgi:hypothetical protein
LEQEAQEILKAQEGTMSSKSSEEMGIEAVTIYHESLVQIRDLPKDQATQERGVLLYQQTQLLMK